MDEKAQDILAQLNINSNQLEELLVFRKNNKASFVLVDIREKFEVDGGYIENCDLFTPTSTFMEHISDFSKDNNIIFYCQSGSRSAQVLSFLKQEGFSKISHLNGGISSYFGSIVK